MQYCLAILLGLASSSVANACPGPESELAQERDAVAAILSLNFFACGPQ